MALTVYHPNNMKHPSSSILLSLGFILTSAIQPLLAQENARLPYRMLFPLSNTEISTIEEPAAHITFKVSSKNPDINPSQITAYIEAEKLILPVPISPDGIMLIPKREDLLATNAILVTNQPKGSLNLEVTGRIQGAINKELYNRKEGKVRYAVFFPQAGMFKSEQESKVSPLVA